MVLSINSLSMNLETLAGQFTYYHTYGIQWMYSVHCTRIIGCASVRPFMYLDPSTSTFYPIWPSYWSRSTGRSTVWPKSLSQVYVEVKFRSK